MATVLVRHSGARRNPGGVERKPGCRFLPAWRSIVCREDRESHGL